MADYLILTVKAVDKDNGESGRVTYHFRINNKNVQETDEFIINPDTGELKTKVILDHKIKEKYQVIFLLLNSFKFFCILNFKLWLFPLLKV